MSARSQEQHPPPNDRVLTHLFFSASDAAHDRVSLPSGLLALLLHALLLLLALGPVGRHLLKTETDPGVGTGIGAGAAGGGGGGRSEEVSMVTLIAPAEAAAAPVPVPVPVPAPVPPPPPPPEPVLPRIDPPKLPPPPSLPVTAAMTATTLPAIRAALAAGGEGTGVGSGRGPGIGPGSGGGSGGGEGGGIGSGKGPGIGRGRLLAPAPDFLLLPPTPTPGAARGKTILVRLAIDGSGVVRDVELIPSTGDRGFDQALRRTALGWHFRPARDAANNAVAVTYDVTFNF